MRKIIILLLIILCFGCDQNQTNKPASSHPNTSLQLDVFVWQKEGIDLDSLSIGSLPVITTKNEVIKIFGNPNKIVKIDAPRENLNLYDFKNKYEKYYMYYKDAVFEVAGEYAILNTLNLENTKRSLFYKGFEINGKTDVRHIQPKFKESFKLARGSGNVFHGIIPINALGNDYMSIILYSTGDRIRKVLITSYPVY